MSRSSQLEVENKRLSVKVEEMKEICTQTSSLNVKYKMQLEREKESKEELLEGNSKLKIKANELATRCFELNEKIRVLESNLKRSSSASVRSSRIPVKIIGNVSEIVQQSDPKASPEYIDLESKYADLERDYQEALAVIDELDFELDDIDYLEMEVHRLQDENVRLREQVQQQHQPSHDDDYNEPSGFSAFSAASFSAATTDDSEEGKEAIGENGNGNEHVQDFVNKMMTITNRKKMMQQKLERFRTHQK